MNRLVVLSALSVGAGLGVLRSEFVDPPVNLQSVTPGTPQSGHINVTGTVLAGTVFASSAGTTDKVVSGWATAPSGFNFGGDFRTASTSGRGVFGSATSPNGFTYGGDFRSASINGRGVFGWATAAAPGSSGIGGEFRSDSQNGIGVKGYATVTNGNTGYGGFFTSGRYGIGVHGECTGTDGIGAGGEFFNSSSGGYGIFVRGKGTGASVQSVAGTALRVSTDGNAPASVFQTFASNADGVQVDVNGEGGNGLYVLNHATNSLSTAGSLYNHSNNGRGIDVRTDSASGFVYSGFFEADSPDGRGAYGFAGSTTGTNYGVYGRTASPTDGYGVFSNGRFGASGTKSFRIDHPLDPANKYLYHYCTEGPLPLNVYQGIAVTDSSGYAWIQLPAYFDEINKDPVYQLTVIDSSNDFALAKVCGEEKANRFQIRTSKPRVKVSWEVKATRNDRFVQAYGAPVESVKPVADKGLYQHPELYGLPSERGINNRDDVQSAALRFRHADPRVEAPR